MPQLIEAGYVYIAQPPLYQVKAGKDVVYAYSDRQLEEIKGTHRRAAARHPACTRGAWGR